MQIRPSRVVTVTTQEELDSAFDSADEMIVEGDDALLSYAATKASGDSGNTVAVETGAAAVSVAASPVQPGRRRWLPPLAAAVVLIVALAGAGYYFLIPRPEAAAPIHHQHHTAAPAAGGAAGSTELPSIAPDDQPVLAGAEGPSEWAPLMWPAVSIVAILALFLIARQAIAGGRNVEISWKVSEKVSGRVVITKVRTPGRRQRAAA
jgi:hypothetical protein